MEERKDFLDLDRITPPDKTVKLGGTEYKIPGSVSTETMIEMLRVSQEIEKQGTGRIVDPDLYEQLLKAYYRIFADKNKGLTFEKFRSVFDIIKHGKALSAFIFGQMQEAEKKTE